jgi:hypothetical protein
MHPTLYRRGGVLAVGLSLDIEIITDDQPDSDLTAWVARHRSAALARYRNAGQCTEIELRTIEQLWLRGVGLRALARCEGVTPSAISERIAGLGAHKAPEFTNYWKLKNRRRRKQGGRRSAS